MWFERETVNTILGCIGTTTGVLYFMDLELVCNKLDNVATHGTQRFIHQAVINYASNKLTEITVTAK